MSASLLDSNDPACSEIVARTKALALADTPDRIAHALGSVTLANGSVVNAHVVHAADAIVTDGERVLMIARKNEPGKGKHCLPGGFMDNHADGRAETSIETARREAKEETGVAVAEGVAVGHRNFDRPFDIRIASHDLPEYGIAKGDVFMLSSQAIRFDMPGLKNAVIKAEDDVDAAYLVPIAELTQDAIGIPDHYTMLQQSGILANQHTASSNGWGHFVKTATTAPKQRI